jgi:hypothetical protein
MSALWIMVLMYVCTGLLLLAYLFIGVYAPAAVRTFVACSQRCPACTQRAIRPAGATPAETRGAPTVHHYRCEACGAGFSRACDKGPLVAAPPWDDRIAVALPAARVVKLSSPQA